MVRTWIIFRIEYDLDNRKLLTDFLEEMKWDSPDFQINIYDGHNGSGLGIYEYQGEFPDYNIEERCKSVIENKGKSFQGLKVFYGEVLLDCEKKQLL